MDKVTIAKEYIDKIATVCNEANIRSGKLNKDLSKVELEIQDILHFIEFENFSACRGYAFAKKLKELRLQRREIKDELEPLQSLVSNLQRYIPLLNKKLKNRLKKMEHRLYTPRILKFTDDQQNVVNWE